MHISGSMSTSTRFVHSARQACSRHAARSRAPRCCDMGSLQRLVLQLHENGAHAREVAASVLLGLGIAVDELDNTLPPVRRVQVRIHLLLHGCLERAVLLLLSLLRLLAFDVEALELFLPLAGVPESPAFAAGALEDLKGLGLNTARVGFLWSRYETAPGQWNETYLGQVEGLLDQLRDHGMYAILDMHQDQMR